jgi:hypothetical protein
MELETASFQAGRLADFAELIALAAEGLEADGDTINAPKFYAAADALRESLDKLKMEIFRIVRGLAARTDRRDVVTYCPLYPSGLLAR